MRGRELKDIGYTVSGHVSPGRSFTEAVGGVVLQERAGEAHLAAVALDLAVDGRRGETRVTLVVRSDGRRVAG